MKEVARLQQRLQESERRNDSLQGQITSLRTSFNQVVAEFAALRRDHEALIDATRIVTGERDIFQKRAAELEAVNKRLVDMLWGRRSERRSDSPDQMRLAFAVDPPIADEQEIIMAQTKADEAADRQLLRRLEARRKARREQEDGNEDFPPDIERREQTIDLSEEEKEGLTQIGVKETKRLRFEKPHVYVEVIHRPQYVVASQPEEGVRSAPPPLAIVEGCKYDFSVIAAIGTMKFAFHMPTYRQQDWFGQCGWFPSRSTTNNLINYGVATIGPLYQQMWQLLLRQPILLGDDTRLRVLLRGALDKEQLASLGKRSRFRQAAEGGGATGSATSFAWLYTSLDGFAPYNVFHWSLVHQNTVIDGHLATYRGIFVGDACGANARLEQRSSGRIVHASCNAHARREFVKAESNDPVLASQGLSFYRQLYDVEERAKTLDAVARRELRNRDALPIWNRMERWLASDPVQRVLPRSAIGEAVGYLRNQWKALKRYLSDGNIPIDNDQSESTLRPLVVGRGNLRRPRIDGYLAGAG